MTHPNKIKGSRIEREMKEKFINDGFSAKKIPLSGAAEFAGKEYAGDVQVQWEGETLVTEIKGRKKGAGFKVIEGWLGNKDFLLLKRNRKEPLCVMPWKTLIKLMRGELKIWIDGEYVQLEIANGEVRSNEKS